MLRAPCLLALATLYLSCLPVKGQDVKEDDERKIDALIEFISDPAESLKTRQAACDKLASFGPRAKKAVPVLIKILDDSKPDDSLKTGCAWVLRAIGRDAAPAFESLAKLYDLERFAGDHTLPTALCRVGIDPMTGGKRVMPALVRDLDGALKGKFKSRDARGDRNGLMSAEEMKQLIRSKKEFEKNNRTYLEVGTVGEANWRYDYLVESVAHFSNADAGGAVAPLQAYLRTGIACNSWVGGYAFHNGYRNPRDLQPEQCKTRLLAVEALRKIGNDDAKKVLNRISLVEDLGAPVREAAEKALKSFAKE